jgi:hypothetical protein
MKAARTNRFGSAFAFACQAKHLKRQNKEPKQLFVFEHAKLISLLPSGKCQSSFARMRVRIPDGDSCSSPDPCAPDAVGD